MAQISDALGSFAKKVGPSDNFLIFYEGQSYWDTSTERGFWLPSDAKGTGFWFLPSDENESKGLAWLINSMLGNYLRGINSKHTLLVINTCLEESVFNIKSIDKGPVVAVSTLNELTGEKVITEGVCLNNPVQSDFLKYLLDNLEKNPEKYLPSEKLYINALKSASDIVNVTPRFSEINNSGDTGGDFIFIRKD
jgi:hypothetical protein